MDTTEHLEVLKLTSIFLVLFIYLLLLGDDTTEDQ